MTWVNIVLALILFACIIYVLVLAIDLRKTLKRAEWILEDVDESLRVSSNLIEGRTARLKHICDDVYTDMTILIRNLETLNNECNATLIRAKELVHEDIFDSTEDDLK